MHRVLSLLVVALIPFVATYQVPQAQHIFSNPLSSVTAFNIPTTRESAVLARRILHLENIGTLSTVYPRRHDETSASLHGNPQDLTGKPVGLMDYFADCEPATGNPTLLAVSIATSFRNEAAGSNISLSVRWHPGYSHQYSAASMPRFSVIGYLEKISSTEVESLGVEGCFTGYHPDAVTWFPGNGIHESEWARLVVKEVYWIGGFGDRAYIGWIPVDDWRSVTKEEIQKARLPGEKPRNGWLSLNPW